MAIGKKDLKLVKMLVEFEDKLEASATMRKRISGFLAGHGRD